MLRVALTGGIGTGKSYVLSRLRDAGVPIIDADILAREAVAVGSPGLAAVVERFGEGVLAPEGWLDRARLATIVFDDTEARRDLEAIVHPIVRRRIDEFYEGLPEDTAFAVADIPLLYETGRQRYFDKVIVAACDRETQIARVMSRDGLTRAEAERRMAAQLPIDAKVTLADYVIRTDGPYAQTDQQVTRVIEALTRDASSAHHSREP